MQAELWSEDIQMMDNGTFIRRDTKPPPFISGPPPPPPPPSIPSVKFQSSNPLSNNLFKAKLSRCGRVSIPVLMNGLYGAPPPLFIFVGLSCVSLFSFTQNFRTKRGTASPSHWHRLSVRFQSADSGGLPLHPPHPPHPPMRDWDWLVVSAFLRIRLTISISTLGWTRRWSFRLDYWTFSTYLFIHLFIFVAVCWFIANIVRIRIPSAKLSPAQLLSETGPLKLLLWRRHPSLERKKEAEEEEEEEEEASRRHNSTPSDCKSNCN